MLRAGARMALGKEARHTGITTDCILNSPRHILNSPRHDCALHCLRHDCLCFSSSVLPPFNFRGEDFALVGAAVVVALRVAGLLGVFLCFLPFSFRGVHLCAVGVTALRVAALFTAFLPFLPPRHGHWATRRWWIIVL